MAIRAHSKKLLKVKVQSEFDIAIAHDDPHSKLDSLKPFGPSGRMSGDVLVELFGEDDANHMRKVSKTAFIDAAKMAVDAYGVSAEENDLYRADYWRTDAKAKWSEIIDNVDGLKATVKKNGHSLDI